MGCFKKNIRDFFLRFDLLAVDATLRTRGQPTYESVGCGVISLIMIGAFIGIFANQILNVLSKAEIQATFKLDDQPESENNISGIRFAFGLGHMDFEQTKSYFYFQLASVTKIQQQQKVAKIELVRCTKEIWESYGHQLSSYYESLHIGGMYCVPPEANMSLYGLQGSTNFSNLKFSVAKCHPPNNNTACKSDDEINLLFDTLGYIPIRLLFVNKIISPTHETAVTKTLEKDMFLSLSKHLGTRGQIHLGRFQIATDESIWPFTAIVTQVGHYIQSFKTFTVGIIPTEHNYDPTGLRNNKYIDIDISKSSLVYNVQRVHEKIDDLLSYIGGLFSLIFVAVSFVFGSFNQYRYELRVAESSFSHKQRSKKIREKDMGYTTYFAYSVYDWLKMLGFELKWEKMQRIGEAREEAVEQLDVYHITKKLRYFEWCLSLLMKDSQKIASYLIKPITLDQSRKNRKLLQYYDKVIRNQVEEEIQAGDKIVSQQCLSVRTHKVYLPIEQIRHRTKKNEMVPAVNNQDNHQAGSQPPMSQKNMDYYADNKDSISQSQHQSQQNQYQNQKQENQLSQKYKKLLKKIPFCDEPLEDQYDSQDEKAERILYQHFKVIVTNNSKASELIKQCIPPYLKQRMLAKMKYESPGVADVLSRGDDDIVSSILDKQSVVHPQ